jgi:hypothetical protein
MAKPPELVRKRDGDLRVDASFPSGRYTFTLRRGAVDLLTELGYCSGDVVPWYLFKSLAIVGDVQLPNTSGPIADDLAAPDTLATMDDAEAAALARYLERCAVDSRDRERFEDVIAWSALDDHLSLDDLDSTERRHRATAAATADTETDASLDRETADESVADRSESVADRGESVPDRDRDASTADRDPDASILHVGKTTLGRRNMGREARTSDYLDAFSQAIDIAIDREVDAVVHTGRLFQRGSPDRETVSGLQTELARLRDEAIPFYLVCGPKEVDCRSTVLRSLMTSGLLTLIGSETVDIGDGVTLVGVDADGDPERVLEGVSADGPADGDSLLVACGDLGLADPSATAVEAIADRSPTRPAAVLAGKRTDAVGDDRHQTRLLDPGSVEHVLSKSTVGADPPARGVNEYAVADGGVWVTRHELDARPFSAFELDVTGSTTLDSIRERVSQYDLDDRAVLAVLTGSGPDAAEPSREAVQSLLADRAYCARVYDDRSVPEEADETRRESTPDAEADSRSDRAGDVERSSDTEHSTDTEQPPSVVQDLAAIVSELEAMDPGDFSQLETAALADCYAVFSKAKSAVEDDRTAARDELTSRVDPDETVAGSVGAVSGAKQRQRSLRDAETVESVLREHGVPVERVTIETIDPDRVDELLASEATGIDESDVFDVTEIEYVRRREFDPDAGTSKVYLGSGAEAAFGGWIPVEQPVVEGEIVPLVTANEVGDDEGISMNFGSDVSIGGWHSVDVDVVRDRIVPLIEDHRVPEEDD